MRSSKPGAVLLITCLGFSGVFAAQAPTPGSRAGVPRPPSAANRGPAPEFAGNVAEPDVFDSLLPNDPEARKLKFEQIARKRTTDIELAMRLITTRKDVPAQTSRVLDAIKFLSVVRAKESTNLLLEMIEYPPVALPQGPGLTTDRPCIKALAEIGRNSSVGAVDYIAKDKSEPRAKMYLRVIYLIEGTEVGKFMLDLAAKNEPDPDKKARLQKAIELFANADKAVP